MILNLGTATLPISVFDNYNQDKGEVVSHALMNQAYSQMHLNGGVYLSG